jgi:hypothetical protein
MAAPAEAWQPYPAEWQSKAGLPNIEELLFPVPGIFNGLLLQLMKVRSLSMHQD